MQTSNKEPDVRVLRSGSCPSLSGKSKLSYDFGHGPAGQLQIRITKNSAAGYFSQDWVAWDRLLRVLEKNGLKPITSFTLSPLFAGKSVNTAGFLLAVLKKEGLVQAMAEKPRCYEPLDATAFLAGLQTLLDAPPKAAKPRSPKR